MRFRRRKRCGFNNCKTCLMSDLEKGQKGIVKGVHVRSPELRRRLFDMGITRGAEFEIKKISPLGDPIDIIIRGYELCLRKSCMEEIEVEVLE
ncbi:MAG: FeoA family protein [Bacilli bacterium]|nr:FeoA family protein [Bacilli bacterium]